MPNPLTGDFEAVLQVSGGTINRLLASMHQNAFENPKLPSFPHSLRMRIGDDHAYDGVRGVAHAQVSVPRVELFHGATDRFMLEVAVRAWYRPDPGTAPFPAFINGTVRAEYRVQDIDPSCPGWFKNAADFLWVRVVRDSATFRGTAENDQSIFEIGGAGGDPAATIAKVTRQIAHLLARRFEATPHPVSKRFRRGSLRSLNVPTGGSAVALPLGLSGEPVGQITSIENVLLNGSDLALAVNIDHIMSLVHLALDPVIKFSQTVPVRILIESPFGTDHIDAVYQVGVHPPSVQWLPNGSYAMFKINVTGWATTQSSLPKATFSITQDIVLNFGGTLYLAPSSITVVVKTEVIDPFGVGEQIKNELLTRIKPIVEEACKTANLLLTTMSAQTGALSEQLKTLDDKASIGLDSAEFTADGLVLRGTIGLAPRRAIVVKTEKTAAEDAHSALESWIPGGRIDRFDWSWTWFGSGEPGAETRQDRFLLRRPSGGMGHWGMALDINKPLPGLDGWGNVCLKVTGAQVDPATGNWATVISSRRCTRFGFTAAEPFTAAGRLFLREMPELSQDVPFPQLKDLPLIAARRGVGGAKSNTLLLYIDGAWDRQTAGTLAEGLSACGRYDAGLALLVLFREGILQTAGAGLVMDVESKMRELGIPGHVNEDVHGDWARTLELRAGTGEPGWAIITPDGITPWKHRGRVAPRELTSALDKFLRRCPDVRPVAYHPGIEEGQVIPATALHPGIRELAELPCPPPPLFNRLGVNPKQTVVTFVQKDSAASAIHLRRLAAEYDRQDDGRAAMVIVVVDGAGAREAESLRNEVGVDFVMVADPSRKITDRFRVGIWPTTIKLDGHGIVSEAQTGVAGRRHEDFHRRNEEHAGKSDAAL